MKVIVITGDGDCTAIGGNHFIHACRRNIDLTAIIINNNIYGMTGGQYSPTTPQNSKAATAVYGNFDNQFDIVELACGAGATFAAHSTVYHYKALVKLMENAIQHKGFAAIDVMTPCPTYYGRLNKKGSAADMMCALRDETIDRKVAKAKGSADGKTIIGEFKREERPEFCEKYQQLIQSLSQEGISNGKV